MRRVRISRLRGQAAGGQTAPASSTRDSAAFLSGVLVGGRSSVRGHDTLGAWGGLLYVGSRRPEHQVSVVLPLAPRVIGHCTKVSCDAVGVGLAEDGGPTVGLWARGPAGEIWDAGAGASNTQSISSGQSLA
jgi:hypothetical protein